MQGEAGLRVGQGGWFGVLLDEAVATATPFAGPALTGASLDRHVRDGLWGTGAVVGAGEPGPVVARSLADQPFLALVRFELAVGARLVAGLRPGAGSDQRALLLASLMAAHTGELATAVVLDDVARGTHPLDERGRRRLLGVVGARLLRGAYLLGNPEGGLPLHMSLAALDARAFARLARAQLSGQGPLRRRSLRVSDRLVRAKAEGIELLAGTWQGRTDAGVVARQVRAAGLGSRERRRLLRALEAPRDPGVMLADLPAGLREPALEQLVLATLADGLWDALEGRVRAMAAGAGLSAAHVESARARAAALLVVHAAGVSRLRQKEPAATLRDAAAEAADTMARALENVQRELAETTELGALLARQARGEALGDEDRAKVREQLLDLAKVVPNLAILAAPGGALLLPLALRLLPFDLRPSAFRPAKGPRLELAAPKTPPPEAA